MRRQLRLCIAQRSHTPRRGHCGALTAARTIAVLTFLLPLATAVASESEKTVDGSVVEVATAGADHNQPGIVHVPEPMVFDLVRGLSAEQGEWEVNTLTRLPLGTSSSEVLWAPEIEAAVWDGVGVELELPMSNASLVAVKGAVQLRVAGNERLAHGIQAIVEHEIQESFTLVHALYLMAWRPLDRLAFMGMAGARNAHGDGVADSVINFSGFHDAAERFRWGVELNHTQGAVWNQTLLMPQIHLDIGHFARIQAGVGAQGGPRGWIPMASTRFIIEL